MVDSIKPIAYNNNINRPKELKMKNFSSQSEKDQIFVILNTLDCFYAACPQGSQTKLNNLLEKCGFNVSKKSFNELRTINGYRKDEYQEWRNTNISDTAAELLWGNAKLELFEKAMKKINMYHTNLTVNQNVEMFVNAWVAMGSPSA